MENNEDVVFALGEFGKHDLGSNDISIGSFVTCIKNPLGFFFKEGSSYYISGVGGLSYDEKRREYYVGFGKKGYSLRGAFFHIDWDESELNYIEKDSYIPHDILIRNFIHQLDCTPEHIEISKRHVTIGKVLE